MPGFEGPPAGDATEEDKGDCYADMCLQVGPAVQFHVGQETYPDIDQQTASHDGEALYGGPSPAERKDRHKADERHFTGEK